VELESVFDFEIWQKYWRCERMDLQGHHVCNDILRSVFRSLDGMLSNHKLDVPFSSFYFALFIYFELAISVELNLAVKIKKWRETYFKQKRACIAVGVILLSVCLSNSYILVEANPMKFNVTYSCLGSVQFQTWMKVCRFWFFITLKKLKKNKIFKTIKFKVHGYIYLVLTGLFLISNMCLLHYVWNIRGSRMAQNRQNNGTFNQISKQKAAQRTSMIMSSFLLTSSYIVLIAPATFGGIFFTFFLSFVSFRDSDIIKKGAYFL
jgi:hypothetical protein